MGEYNAIFYQNGVLMVYNASLVGREKEITLLNEIVASPRSEFVAIYGRRRVGKTFLIKTLFQDKFTFYTTAMANMNFQGQIRGFNNALTKYFPKEHHSKNWLDVFCDLRDCIEQAPQGPKIIFLDELSWFDTNRSGFVSALEYFWNSWAGDRSDIKLIVCGSATSWILSKIINNHGGLHNRVTRQIRLEPFSLKECKEYFQLQQINFSKREIALCYMAFGGIPFYLSLLNKKLSVSQNIDELFFAEGAELANEFQNLYQSLFKNSSIHIQIVTALSNKGIGLTRDELLKATGLQSSGDITHAIDDLESCGFIRQYTPFGKQKKNGLIQLIDFYTLFYFRFVRENKLKDSTFWSSMQNAPKFFSWAGYAFEMLCLHHIKQLKRALKIEGLQSLPCSWFGQHEKSNVQIDLLLDRADDVINICEMKFTRDPFEIDREYAEKISEKMETFRKASRTKKTLRLTFVSAAGLKDNVHAREVQNLITLEDLFD